MRLTMKILDYTLIALLGTAAAPVFAQDPGNSVSQGSIENIECSEDGCTSDGEVLFRVLTRGEREPAPERAADGGLRPDRRVSIEAANGGRAVAVGKWSVQLPDGGVVWATEDPNLGQPSLNASAPSLVAFDAGRITKPVKFYVHSNYSAFIAKAEVVVFAGSDTDLVRPLARVPLDIAAVVDAEWDGQLPADFAVRDGDHLQYIVRATDGDGSVDETFPQRLQLVRPEEAERGLQRTAAGVEKARGIRLGTEEARDLALVQGAFGGNALRQQNIAIHGSRIRIHGRNLPEGYSLTINGQPHPVDLERKMVAEYLVPIGGHRFDLVLADPDQRELRHSLEIDVTGRYMFAVAIADLTAAHGDTSGSVEPLAADDRFDDGFLLEGRLAFYLKGKIKGKYLVTAHADTQEREVSDLFSGFLDADPQDIFRRLDPDAYYPVYGDDSTTYRDVDTQGRLYVRVDWDRNQALWGNFATGITGTEYGQYVRSLYGAAIDWRSRRSTAYGEAGTQVRAFASEAQTVAGQSEFIGTGGSLYYLRHTDVLPGSELLTLEVRDTTTGRVEGRVVLQRGVDYEIDEFQGRVLLTRPLAQISRELVPTLTRDTPLDGWLQVLLVNYEYVPSGSFDADEVAAGFRGRHWFGDHIGLGATWVDDNRAGDDYSLRGADLTLQAGRGTFVRLEHSETEATSAPLFFSDNGGLSFTELNSGLGARSGQAQAVEARANLRELGWTELDWSAGAWWRQVDAGFSVSRFDQGADIEEHGFEARGQLNADFGLYARASRAERGAESLSQAQVTAEWLLSEDRSVSGELRQVDEQRLAGDATGVLAAVQYKQRVGSSLDLYGIAQFTVDDDSGAYEDNDAFTAGAKYQFGELSTVGAELTTGDRGDAVRVDGEYRLSPEHSFYGGYTYATNQTAYDPLFNPAANTGWTLGQRWRMSSGVNLFNESQFLKAPDQSGLAHTFGMDFFLGQGWNLGFTLQDAELDTSSGVVDRQAVSVSGGRTSVATQWQSKLEWREDSGAEQREQWVSSNRLLHKVSESFRVAARLNWSETDDDLQPDAGAKFVESNVGFAWRPWNSTRYALLGKYTWLYDVSSLPQLGDNVAFYDQRSQVLSFEGVFSPENEWEFAGKLMRREGEVRMGRLSGSWVDSAATFAAGQVRYDIGARWHALAEYRWLGVNDGGDRQGFLVGVDRDIGKHFRVGVGWNFTDFSDDLTNFDYDHRGFFMNFVGSY
jgi:hypothetical protein